MKGFVSFYYYEPLSGTEAAAWLFIFLFANRCQDLSFENPPTGLAAAVGDF
jgi:hypothetical protein